MNLITCNKCYAVYSRDHKPKACKMNLPVTQAHKMFWHIFILKGKKVKSKGSKEIFTLEDYHTGSIDSAP